MSVDFQIKGFNFPSYWNGLYGSAGADTSLTNLVSTGANAVTVNPIFYVDTKTGSIVSLSATKSESVANVSTEIKAAHADGLQVMMKVAVIGLDGTTSANLAPTNIPQFFASYKALVMQYAASAQANHAETLSIGTEMDQLTGSAYKGYWDDIISSVRQVYHGQLTYAANWNTAANVSFWSELDIVGVDGYVPLSSAANPSVQDLKNAWTTASTDPYYKSIFHGLSPLDYYHSLATTYGKPLMFTELGYQSSSTAASNPGYYGTANTVSQDLQAKSLEAFFETWGNQGSWFKGAYLWDWSPVADPTTGANYAKDFTVQGKEGQGVVTAWYGNGVNPLTNPGAVIAAATPVATPAVPTGPLSLTGSAAADSLTGGAYNDTITGGGGQDTLSGGAGDDHLIGGVGHASFYGGAGNDTIDVYDSPTIVDGGAGTDTLNIYGRATFAAGSILNIEKIVVQNGAVADFSAITTALEIYSGSTAGGGAAITGAAGADILHGGAGYDTLTGGAGDDKITAGTGGGALYGGDGMNVWAAGFTAWAGG